MFRETPPNIPGSNVHETGPNPRPHERQRQGFTVAVVGNPNTGKTSLFNALTGFRRHVANYPGVTVDVAHGRVRGARPPLDLLDLPGSYSLSAASPDEAVLSRVLSGRDPHSPRPAAVLAIVDASNPMRNLYLVSQLIELGLPVVVALNMVDVAQARGIAVDAHRLAERLGVPVVPVVATREETIPPLVRALEQLSESPAARPGVRLPDPLVQAIDTLSKRLGDPSRPFVLRALVDRHGFWEEHFAAGGGDLAALRAERERLKAAGLDPAIAEVRARYAWVDGVLAGVVHRELRAADTWSDRLDRVLTHRVLGVLVLVVVLYAVFVAVYAGAAPLMSGVDAVFGWLAGLVARLLPEGVVRSAVVDGAIAGVGAVIVFLPQILILFLFIGLLEDCGYLARAAFMVDRVMRPLGLSGRAFIPLLSGFACAVPAIMGTRTISDRRERITTCLMIPFMSCSARLPVYTLLIGAFVPPLALAGGLIRLDALVLLAMYLLGVLVAIAVALVLRNVVLPGSSGGFHLELPSYKWPRARTVLQRVTIAGRGFLVRAGTIILAVNCVVWALGYFPRSEKTRATVEAQWAALVGKGSALETQQANPDDDNTAFDAALAGAYLRDSYLGRLGKWIEPAIRPLGWDWRIGVAVLASFPAREVVVATLGTVTNLGSGTAETPALRDALRAMRWEDAGHTNTGWAADSRQEAGQPVLTLSTALSLMVFFALCAQCGSTLVIMGRETGSWLWPAVSFVGMTLLAYGGAWVVAQAGA